MKFMGFSLNISFVDADITEEQCDYLYKKYIRMGIKWRLEWK